MSEQIKDAFVRVTLDKLRAALLLYGKHLNDCGHYGESGVCTCGLDEARKL